MIIKGIELSEEIIQKNIKNLINDDGRIKTYSKNRSKKLSVLYFLWQQFEYDKKYTEKQINEIIKNHYDDFCTIRRDLYDFGFLDRTKYGKEYWKEKLL